MLAHRNISNFSVFRINTATVNTGRDIPRFAEFKHRQRQESLYDPMIKEVTHFSTLNWSHFKALSGNVPPLSTLNTCRYLRKWDEKKKSQIFTTLCSSKIRETIWQILKPPPLKKGSKQQRKLMVFCRAQCIWELTLDRRTNMGTLRLNSQMCLSGLAITRTVCMQVEARGHLPVHSSVATTMSFVFWGRVSHRPGDDWLFSAGCLASPRICLSLPPWLWNSLE